MTYLKSWLIFLLSIGVIYTQVHPTFSVAGSPSTQLRDRLLQNPLVAAPMNSDLPLIASFVNLPGTLSKSLTDTTESVTVFDPSAIGAITNDSNSPTPTKPLTAAPAGSPLDVALVQGGIPFYNSDGKIVIALPNNTFKSFYQSSGLETDWLQVELSLPAIETPGALVTYTEHYHGEVVAETSTWALLKFPQSGYLKVAKPKTTFLIAR